jgi:hypothetical protein
MSQVAYYEDLKAGKEEEIQAGFSRFKTKTDELATTHEKLAEAKANVEDTKNCLAEDVEFLMKLQEKCSSSTDVEWEERQKKMEIEACSKAFAVLSSDEAHDPFTMIFYPAFVQHDATFRSHSERHGQGSKVLMDAAKKLNAPQLSAIAIKVKLDASEKVKSAIDDMGAQLLSEKKDEIKLKEFCVEEFNNHQLQTEWKDAEQDDLIAWIEDLMTIKTRSLGEEIDTGLISHLELACEGHGFDWQGVSFSQTCWIHSQEQLTTLQGTRDSETFQTMAMKKAMKAAAMKKAMKAMKAAAPAPAMKAMKK